MESLKPGPYEKLIAIVPEMYANAGPAPGSGYLCLYFENRFTGKVRSVALHIDGGGFARAMLRSLFPVFASIYAAVSRWVAACADETEGDRPDSLT